MKKALIIVDLQNDFCPNGALAVPDGDKIVPVINAIIPKFSNILTSQDMHPVDHCSFGNPPLYKDGSWPKHCVAGTQGAELYKDLKLPENVQKIFKGTSKKHEAYSAFQGSITMLGILRQDNPVPAPYLMGHKVDEVYVCGLATDYCVKATVLDAIRYGFKTFVILDACKGVDIPSGSVNNAYTEMQKAGAKIVSSKRILEDENFNSTI